MEMDTEEGQKQRLLGNPFSSVAFNKNKQLRVVGDHVVFFLAEYWYCLVCFSIAAHGSAEAFMP